MSRRTELECAIRRCEPVHEVLGYEVQERGPSLLFGLERAGVMAEVEVRNLESDPVTLSNGAVVHIGGDSLAEMVDLSMRIVRVVAEEQCEVGVTRFGDRSISIGAEHPEIAGISLIGPGAQWFWDDGPFMTRYPWGTSLPGLDGEYLAGESKSLSEAVGGVAGLRLQCLDLSSGVFSLRLGEYRGEFRLGRDWLECRLPAGERFTLFRRAGREGTLADYAVMVMERLVGGSLFRRNWRLARRVNVSTAATLPAVGDSIHARAQSQWRRD